MPECELVLESLRRTPEDRGVAGGVQRKEAAFELGVSHPLCFRAAVCRFAFSIVR